ncbi:MAG TPA: glycosyltransferase family 9 protein, partial [Steroidobacteraceae bacterium]|nr:glycosyltransferase family 9 protein [Steroidobacteraceae bacterium]
MLPAAEESLETARYPDRPMHGEEPGKASARHASATILICRPNTRLGNTLLITPLIEEIEAALPSARVEILTACPVAHDVFREFPSVRRVHQLPFRGVRHPLRHLLTLLRVRRVRYDVLIDPDPGSWTSGFLARRLAARLKLGFASARKGKGIDIGIPFQGAPAHMGDYPVYLLRRGLLHLDEAAARADSPRLSIRLTEAERLAGRQELERLFGAGPPGPVVAVAAHATGAKRFTVDWWRRMIASLQALLPAVRVLEIRPPNGVAALPEFPAFYSRRVRQVAAVAEAADCFVCADSGLMHLAAATDATTIGLFKVTEPRLYAPRRAASCALTASDGAPERVAERVAQLV